MVLLPDQESSEEGRADRNAREHGATGKECCRPGVLRCVLNGEAGRPPRLQAEILLWAPGHHTNTAIEFDPTRGGRYDKGSTTNRREADTFARPNIENPETARYVGRGPSTKPGRNHRENARSNEVIFEKKLSKGPQLTV